MNKQEMHHHYVGERAIPIPKNFSLRENQYIFHGNRFIIYEMTFNIELIF